MKAKLKTSVSLIALVVAENDSSGDIREYARGILERQEG